MKKKKQENRKLQQRHRKSRQINRRHKEEPTEILALKSLTTETKKSQSMDLTAQ